MSCTRIHPGKYFGLVDLNKFERFGWWLTTISQIALISVENKKMEISHKLFTSWLNDLTLIGSEDVIKEILRRNLQKFHSLFCKALGLLQGTFPSMLAPRFVSAATSLIR